MAGLPYLEAGSPLVVPSAYAKWGNPERLVITMAAAYRSLGDEPHELLDVLAHAADAEPRETRR